MVLCSVLSVIVVAILYILSENFLCYLWWNICKATGMKTDFLQSANSCYYSINHYSSCLVGSLLISALVIFPALSAMHYYIRRSLVLQRFVQSYYRLLYYCSYWFIVHSGRYASDSTIVAIDIVAFMISCAAGKLAGGRAWNLKNVWFCFAILLITGCSNKKARTEKVSTIQIRLKK